MPGSVTTTRTVLQDIPLRNNLRASNGVVTFTRASSAWYEDDTGVVQAALTNIPRISPTKGLLIEEARTNYWLNSNAAASATSYGVGLQVTSSIESGPFATAVGSAEVDAVHQTLSTNECGIRVRHTTAPTAGIWTMSTWIASGSLDAGGALTACNTAMYGSANVPASVYVPRTVTAAYQRVTQSMYIDAGVTEIASYIILGSPDPASPGPGTIKVSHCQLESGAFATSPILTAGTAVTRAVENVTVPTIDWPTKSGTISATLTAGPTGTQGPAVETLGISIYKNTAGGLGVYWNGGAQSYTSTALTWTEGVSYNISVTWGPGCIRIYRNGVLVKHTATGVPPMNAHGAVAYIGVSQHVSGEKLNGQVSNVKVSRI